MRIGEQAWAPPSQTKTKKYAHQVPPLNPVTSFYPLTSQHWIPDRNQVPGQDRQRQTQWETETDRDRYRDRYRYRYRDRYRDRYRYRYRYRYRDRCLKCMNQRWVLRLKVITYNWITTGQSLSLSSNNFSTPRVWTLELLCFLQTPLWSPPPPGPSKNLFDWNTDWCMYIYIYTDRYACWFHLSGKHFSLNRPFRENNRSE